MAKRDIILLDGACGTALWDKAKSAGFPQKSVWTYSMEHPELVLAVHREYIAAGAMRIQTNTFSVNPASLARESDYTVPQVIAKSAALALEACDGTAAKPYLSFGPLPTLLEPYGDLEEDEAEEIYAGLAKAGVAAGVKTVALETFMDLHMMELAARACLEAGAEVLCSLTFEKHGRTMMGDTVEKIVQALEPLGVSAVGMNCAHGPVQALDILRHYAGATKLPLYYKPNAGTGENYSAEQFAAEMAPALELASYVGGCCGCDSTYIRRLAEML